MPIPKYEQICLLLQVRFGYTTPYHLTTEKSLESLNQESPTHITMERFRSNIVIGQVEGPYIEVWFVKDQCDIRQLLIYCSRFGLKAHANGRNILGQQHATLLGPTCCVRLYGITTMLALVGTGCVQFETSQTFRPMQTDATLLAKNSQQHATML